MESFDKLHQDVTFQLSMPYPAQPSNDHSPRNGRHLYQSQAPIPQLLQAEASNRALFPPRSAERAENLEEVLKETTQPQTDSRSREAGLNGVLMGLLPVRHVDVDDACLQEFPI